MSKCRKGGSAFGQEPESAYEVTQAVREATNLPIIVKLSPNITYTKIAEAAASAGGRCHFPHKHPFGNGN